MKFRAGLMILLATPPKHSSATLLTKTASDWPVQYNNQYFELPQNFLHSPGLQLEINKVVCDQFLPSANSSVSVMLSNHLILCHPLLILPLIFPGIRVSSNELALHIR